MPASRAAATCRPSPRRRRSRPSALWGLATLLALAAAVLGAAVATAQSPAPTQPTAVPPTSPPPTAAPPTDQPPPTEEPRDEDDDEDDEDRDQPQPPPPPAASETPTPGPTPTRTRRPTRTPRTTPTLTPTPMVAGGLRLVLSADPPVPAAGEGVELAVSLANRSSGAISNVTVQLAMPGDVLIDAVDGGGFAVARTADLLRWYLPVLPPGADAVLRARGVLARARPDGLRLCALVLSAAQPAEVCARIAAREPEPSTGTPGATATAAPGEATSRRPSGTAVGVGLILFGLLATGVLVGGQLRRRG